MINFHKKNYLTFFTVLILVLIFNHFISRLNFTMKQPISYNDIYIRECNHTFIEGNKAGNRVLMFYVYDRKYITLFPEYKKLCCYYAQKYNYLLLGVNDTKAITSAKYIDELINSSRIYTIHNDPRIWRVIIARTLLDTYNKHFDYIVYLDPDIAFNPNLNLSIPNLVNAIENKMKQNSCDVISQDFTDMINSGFLIFKNTIKSRM